MHAKLVVGNREVPPSLPPYHLRIACELPTALLTPRGSVFDPLRHSLLLSFFDLLDQHPTPLERTPEE